MAAGNFVLIIDSHQGYLKNSLDENTLKRNSVLFTAMTETYIPLLNMMGRLEEENIPFRFGIVLSPAVTTLLKDPMFQEEYAAHLEKLINLGRDEVIRLEGCSELAQAQAVLSKYEQTLFEFNEKYARNIVAEFKEFEKKGFIELIPTAATYAYLPHYSDMTEALNAQVEAGLVSQKSTFGDAGSGFMLPYLAYDDSIDKVLRAYGVNYTVVDARSVLFSDDCPEHGIFAPIRSSNSLVLFAQDPFFAEEVTGDEGYASNEVYRSAAYDIGYDLPQENLGAVMEKDGGRFQTGYRYYRNTDDRETYDEDEASRQAVDDAIEFCEKRGNLLREAGLRMKDTPSMVCVVPAEILGQKWSEGILWLENITRWAASKGGFRLALCRDLLDKQFVLKRLKAYPCSANGLGFGEDLLDSSNSWLVRYIRKATQRMIDITERFPSESSLKERLLNMAARQILIAQSGEWPEMLHEGRLSEEIKTDFSRRITEFTRVYDALASNTVSTEWLTECEKDCAIFPKLNYRIFSRKK